jgi:hypothetical protein
VVELLLILVAAIGGKFLGALAAARLSQVPHRQAAALGVLMNTRGSRRSSSCRWGCSWGCSTPGCSR